VVPRDSNRRLCVAWQQSKRWARQNIFKLSRLLRCPGSTLTELPQQTVLFEVRENFGPVLISENDKRITLPSSVNIKVS
jgi:hypothetical protein